MVATSNDYTKNNPLMESNMAIIVTSYNGHLPFLKYALTKYRETGKYVICSYDTHGASKIPGDIWKIPHAWVFKHKTFGAGKRNGWLWDILYGAGIVMYSDFDYVFHVNGDCVWDKPEGVEDVINLLGDNDLISSSSNGTIHSCSVLWKADRFLDFVNEIRYKLKNNIRPSYSPEVLLRDYAKNQGLKNKVAPDQPRYPSYHRSKDTVDHYSGYNQDSTWKKLLGYRNLGGEHKYACQEHLDPVPKKYVDIRNRGQFYNQHEIWTLVNYYNTGDRRYLYKYWAEGEDSYWNRRYYDLEWYGPEALQNDSKRLEFGPPSERAGYFDKSIYSSYILKDKEYRDKWKSVIDGGG